MILFLKAGSAFQTVIQRQGDFETLFAKAMGLKGEQLQAFDINQGQWPNPQSLPHGVVVMGSHHMVTENLPWMEEAAIKLRQLVSKAVPVLGVCFGHQLLAHAFGGIVNNNPNGLEIGTVDIQTTAAAAQDPLFRALPAKFQANVTHSQCVLKPPKDAVILGASALDGCQAYRIGSNAWGVQYHPEFDAEVMSLYIDGRYSEIEASGLNAEQLLVGVAETEKSSLVLRQFVEYCGIGK